MKFLKLITTRRLAWGLFAGPVLLATLYYSLIAVDRYASTTVITVRDTSAMPSAGSSVASMLLGAVGAPASYTDTLFIESYIHSMDMLQKLDQRLNLREHYSSPRRDLFYRLSSTAGREDFLAYFRERVSLTHDEYSGLLTVEVQGFEPAFAQKVAQAIVEESEAMVNENSHRIAREKLNFAESEAHHSLTRLQKAKGDVLSFQTKYKLLDPMSQAVASNTLTASLQATQAKQEADLKAALSFMSEDSLQVRSLRSQLAATQAQLEVERLRATSAVNGSQLPALAIEYQGLLTQATFADEAYKGSLVAMEQARLDASRKLKTVLVMEPATLPDLPEYPHRLVDWLTVVALCAMLFTIGRLIHATIREHQD